MRPGFVQPTQHVDLRIVCHPSGETTPCKVTLVTLHGHVRSLPFREGGGVGGVDVVGDDALARGPREPHPPVHHRFLPGARARRLLRPVLLLLPHGTVTTSRLADSSEGNMLGVWYKSVDYGARAAPLCPPPLSAGSAREAFVRTGLRDEG